MESAERLRHYIESLLPDFELQEDGVAGYAHMGALIADSVLQAGIRCETVVAPQVEMVLATYPAEAETTSGFARVLTMEGATKLLDWSVERKMNTLVDVTLFLMGKRWRRLMSCGRGF